jgi:diketogulonate reductase-like aldo/keto reductase
MGFIPLSLLAVPVLTCLLFTKKIELHPYCYQKAKNLVDYCHSRGIVIEVFCALAPLTQFPGGPVDAVVKDIACKLGATDDQVLLKWAHQVTYGGIVLVSSTSCKKARLEGYRRAFTGMPDLSMDQIKAISEAGARKHQRVYGTRMDEGPSV